MNKAKGSNIKADVNKAIVNLVRGDNTQLHNVFKLGYVVDNNDPENANRIKVRIPLVDDGFFVKENNEKNSGISKLPWCVPNNKQFINTPELNTVVIVAVFDIENPFIGRIWIDGFMNLSAKDLFSTQNLGTSLTKTPSWQNAQDSLRRTFDATPGIGRAQEYPEQSSTTKDIRVGIKGKDKNSVVLDKGKTTITQNQEQNTESKIELTKDIQVLSSDLIKILSSKSNTQEKPVFASYVHEYNEALHSLLKAIVQILSTNPGTSTSPGTPVKPATASASLRAKLNNLAQKQQELKNGGTSKYLSIN